MTIPKNTNKAKAIISNAHNVRCYALGNNFSGEPLAEKISIWGPMGTFTPVKYVTPAEYLALQLAESRSTKLSKTSNGSYILHVHSNLWYEFDTLKPLINHVERVETYQLLTGNGKQIRKATKAVFSDGFEIKFTEYIPSKTDAANQAIALRSRLPLSADVKLNHTAYDGGNCSNS